MPPLFSSTGSNATGTQASGGGSRTQRLKRKARELKRRAEQRIQPDDNDGGRDDSGESGSEDDGRDLDPGDSEAPDTERVSRAQRKAENRSRIERLKQRAKRKVGLDDGSDDDVDPQRVKARREQIRSRQFDNRRQAKIAAAQRKIQGIAQAARDASASVDPDSVGEDMTGGGVGGDPGQAGLGQPGGEFDPVPGMAGGRDQAAVERLKDRQAQQGRTGVEEAPGNGERAVPSAESAALGGATGGVVEATTDPESVGDRAFEAAAADQVPDQQPVDAGFDPIPGGVEGPGQTTGTFTRRDLSIPERQEQLERQAETNLVDVAGGALETATENPYKTAAATIASPAPGDEFIGAPLALLAGTGAAVSGFVRYGPEIPVPSNPFDRGTNEIPVGEQSPIKETVTPDVGNPPEITIPQNPNLGQSELPASESVREQPEIVVGGDTGGQSARSRQRDSVVPDQYPTDPRRRNSVQEQILWRDAGAVGVGTGTGTEIGESVGGDLVTPDEPSIEDGGREVLAQREFPTGEQAVVGESVASEDVSEPEVTVEDDPLSITGGETGFEPQFGSGAGSATEPTFGQEAYAPTLRQDDTAPELGSSDATGNGFDTASETGPGVGTVPGSETNTGTPTQVGTPTAVSPGIDNPGAFDPAFEQPPGYPTGFEYRSPDPSRRRRPPTPEYNNDPQDERRRRESGGLDVFQNPIAGAEDVVGTPTGEPVSLDLGGDADTDDYDPAGFTLDIDGDGGVF